MPKVPLSLEEGLRAKKVIPFVGAGVSMAARRLDGSPLFPSWRELLLRGADRLVEEGKPAEMVRELVNEDRDYLAAAGRLRDKLKAGWSPFLKEELVVKRSEVADESLDLARAIWALGSRLILTTNYDRVLRWACPNADDLAVWDIEAIDELAQLLRDGTPSSPTVWHLHGRIDNTANLVLTPDGYRQLYPQGDNPERYQAAWATLRHQLVSKSFIFIGFSFSDESLGRALQTTLDVFGGSAGPHYALVYERAVDQLRQQGVPVELLAFEEYGEPLLNLVRQLGQTAGSVPAAGPGEPAAPQPPLDSAVGEESSNGVSENTESEPPIEKTNRGAGSTDPPSRLWNPKWTVPVVITVLFLAVVWRAWQPAKVSWTRYSSEQGSASAQYQMGLWSLEGKNLDRDHDKAREWMTRSAKAGYAKAQLWLARYHESDGRREEALEWYRLASDQGNMEAHKRHAELSTNLAFLKSTVRVEEQAPPPLESLPRPVDPPPLASLTDIADPRLARRTYNVDGSGLAVAVLDTGLRMTHVDFRGRVLGQQNFTADNNGDPGDASDGDGHGTNVAGIIAANDIHVGVAPGAKLVPVKILGDNGSGSFLSVEKALLWVADNHAELGISVVNLSIGASDNNTNDEFSPPPALWSSIDHLYKLKIPVVVAAGNDYASHGSNQGMSFPAILRSTISVGAVYTEDAGPFSYGSGAQAFSTAPDRLAPYSQRLHPSVDPDCKTDIFAPGGPITTSGISSDLSESTQQGTAQAAPFVTGVVLLMQQYHLRLTKKLPEVDDLVRWMREGGVGINDGDDEDDNVVNTGLDFIRIDPLQALKVMDRDLARMSRIE